jgi:hypothetical protein
MSVQIEAAEPAPSADLIEFAERSLRKKLPDTYRGFLEMYNGATPEDNVFEVSGPHDCSGVLKFLSLAEMIETYDRAKIFREFPSYAPIGYDDFGNFICVSLEGADAGGIYFLDHERDEATGALSRLAASPQAFLDILEPFDVRSA